MPVYGIDLGTTYSAIAKLNENNMPIIIQNVEEGSFTLPSAVYFPEDSSDITVGREAKAAAASEPERVFQHVKRYIGKDMPEEELAKLRRIGKSNENPITISSYILKRMIQYANEQGEAVEDAVITCPAYFNNEQREATRQAGILAGLNVLDIVNEPTAAAIYHCHNLEAENQKILVYDLGGGTFDVTVIDMIKGDGDQLTIDAMGTAGNDELGGIDWDKKLYEYILQEYSAVRGY